MNNHLSSPFSLYTDRVIFVTYLQQIIYISVTWLALIGTNSSLTLSNVCRSCPLSSTDLTDGMYHHLPSQWPTPADVTPKPTAPRPPPEPYFVPTASKNATIRQGDPAFLSCQVENLGAYTVSWIRVRDLHILTVDRYTYTADQRFQSLHNNETGEWTLNIKWTERKDTGIYECQVSTLPVKSLALYLIVLGKG